MSDGWFIPVLALALALGGPARAEGRAKVISTGQEFKLQEVLQPEGTTVLLFIQEASATERQFVADLEKELPENTHLALREVRLKSLEAPVAKSHDVKMTPTAIVYDRFGHVLARTSDAKEVTAAAHKGLLMGRIFWIDEENPKAPEVYGAPAERIKAGIPGIVKTMSLRPETMRMFNQMSELHFSDGFLKRREHELIGAYVSALNQCKF